MARKQARKITEIGLRRLHSHPPEARQSIQEEGLRVEANPSGKITFFASYYHDGVKVKQKLGDYPTISVADARRLLLNLKHQLTVQEVNPRESSETVMGFIRGDFGAWCRAHRKSGKDTMQRLEFNFAEHTIGKAKLKNVTQQQVEVWVAEASKRYQPATTIRVLGDLSRVFSKAVEWGLLKKNPVSKVRRPKNDDAKKKLYLTEDEFARLTKAVDQWEYDTFFGPPALSSRRPAYLPTIVRLAVNTGMRRGEILKLRWSDVAEKGKRITIRGEHAKSSTTRVVPISEKLARHLKEWNSLSGREHESDEDARVFPVDSFKRSWHTLKGMAELEHITFHQLRHHFASTLVLRGVPITVVSALLGHTDIKTTQIYLSVRDQDRFDAVNLL